MHFGDAIRYLWNSERSEIDMEVVHPYDFPPDPTSDGQSDVQLGNMATGIANFTQEQPRGGGGAPTEGDIQNVPQGVMVNNYQGSVMYYGSSGLYSMSTPAYVFDNDLSVQEWTPVTLNPTSPDLVPPTRKKRKIGKLKKNASSEEVAVAIAKHTAAKAKEVDKQTQMMEAKNKQEEERIKQEQKELVMSKNRLSFYKAQKERLGKNINEIREEFLAQVEELRQLEGVQEVTIDSEGRIVITTTPLSVQKEEWDEPKVAGQYSIRIDFSKTNISQGVKVLNVTQSYGDYDSPTISNTSCCWGNLQKDVERDFYTQNLIELVGDMMEYCISPYESHGYLGLSGDKHKGWEQFFAHPAPRPANYNWENWDREHANEEEFSDSPQRAPQLETSSNSTRIEGSVLNGVLAGASPSRDVAPEIVERLNTENQVLRERLEESHPTPQNAYEQELLHAFQQLGLTEEAGMGLFAQIIHENHAIHDFRLQTTTINGNLAFRLEGRSHMGTIFDRYLSPADFQPAVIREQEHHPQQMVRGYQLSRTPHWMEMVVGTPSLETDQPIRLIPGRSPVPTYELPDIQATTTSAGTSLSETAMEQAMQQAEQTARQNEEALRASNQMLESFRNAVLSNGTSVSGSNGTDSSANVSPVQNSPLPPQSESTPNGSNNLDVPVQTYASEYGHRIDLTSINNMLQDALNNH